MARARRDAHSSPTQLDCPLVSRLNGRPRPSFDPRAVLWRRVSLSVSKPARRPALAAPAADLKAQNGRRRASRRGNRPRVRTPATACLDILPKADTHEARRRPFTPWRQHAQHARSEAAAARPRSHRLGWDGPPRLARREPPLIPPGPEGPEYQ